MAETQTVILNRMLGNISSEYDTSEGSFFYDILNSAAIEIEKLSYSADSNLDKGFADTATGKALDRKVADQGITRKTTTKASGAVTITGTVGAVITTGQYVASDSTTYSFTQDAVIPASGNISVSVECISYGAVGNVPIGAIKYFPKTLAGLTTVTNSAAFDNGTDDESDASLRARYYTKVQAPSTSGNKNDYIIWATSISNVGGAKVVAVANGAGTVKVIIIDSDKTGADATLIATTAAYIETVRPIDATVQVVSATEKTINIGVTVQIDSINVTQAQVKTSIENNIKTYLASIAFKQDYVSYAQLGSIILSTTGVTDYSALLANNGTINIPVADLEVAVLGVVTLG